VGVAKDTGGRACLEGAWGTEYKLLGRGNGLGVTWAGGRGGQNG
jgi:hypothetical protein